MIDLSECSLNRRIMTVFHVRQFMSQSGTRMMAISPRGHLMVARTMSRII